MAEMTIVDFENIFIFILLCLFSFFWYSFIFKKPNNSKQLGHGCDLPPSPPSLPIIGHIHLLLSGLIHKSFQKLTYKYGPLLYIRIFNAPLVLISSASMAYEFYRTHDLNVSFRGDNPLGESLFAGRYGFASAPYGEYFRFMKKLLVTKMLGPHALERSQGIRAAEVRRFYDNRFDELLERILEEHGEKVDEDDETDIMDVFLAAQRDENAEYKITRNHIKALFVELLVAGTDTSRHATEWTMAEIIKNPNVFKRLREEIESVVGKTRLIQETDLPNLPYLQAVVKESLRLYPPFAVFPRSCIEGCKMGEFYVPENTPFFVNAYAVMRDPDSWEDPDEFKPERFLTCLKGEGIIKEQSLKYIPFGGGRRGCPGSSLAYIFVEMAVGVMVQGFDWRIIGAEINMEEVRGGVSMIMAHPPNCTPIAHTQKLTSHL